MGLDTIQKAFFSTGALFAFSSVAAGAFGAHFLKTRLPEEALNTFEVAARYQMYHALALCLVPLIYNLYPNTLINASGYFFITGILLFSGSLYALSLSGIKILGAITPIGGIFFLIGWICLTFGTLWTKSS